MSLVGIYKTLDLVDEQGVKLTQEEREFVFRFAFQTDDVELTAMLVEELVTRGEDKQAIMTKYEAICDVKPEWLKQLEDLLVALELYRLEEEKAVTRLATLLAVYGITVSEEEIRKMDTKAIEKKAKRDFII